MRNPNYLRMLRRIYKRLIDKNVRYWFCDWESLIFWFKGIPIPEDFNIEKHWREVDLIISKYNTSKGLKPTNIESF